MTALYKWPNGVDMSLILSGTRPPLHAALCPCLLFLFFYLLVPIWSLASA